MKIKSSRRLRFVRDIIDARDMSRAIRRMAGEIAEREGDLDRLLLVGIRTRGLPLAERLAAEIESMEGACPDLGAIDITLYRDDLSVIAPQPLIKGSSLPGPIDGRIVVLCDDVLYTGRTVRAALVELADYGRPRAVRLAVLIDRGHRELPIQADIVGKQVQTIPEEHIEVGFETTDGSDYVRLYLRNDDCNDDAGAVADRPRDDGGSG